MTLPIKLSDIHFGERDALHEYLKQDRQNVEILDNAFVVPPRVKMNELERGARYLLIGPKGSGKTTLLLHLKRKSEATRSKLILFKSEIRKEDRDRLDRMVDLIIVEDQKKYRVEADYKTIWEWYILKTLFSIIEPDDIFKGRSLFNDIKTVLGVKTHRINTVYDNFFIDKIKGSVRIAAGISALKSELKTEIDARRTGENIDLLDLIRLIQSVCGHIRLRNGVSIRLYIDEIEFFMSDTGDGDRDRRLVRDLIFSVNSINQIFSQSKSDVVVYASVRSEILRSFSLIGQEVDKTIDAFGVHLNWYDEDAESHPVLEIIENKIRFSEIGLCGKYSEDTWTSYFPSTVSGKPTRNYLLDLGLHRPRGVLLRIQAALQHAKNQFRFSEQDFVDSEEVFGQYMLTEFIEELSASYNEKEQAEILSVIRGKHFAFTLVDFRERCAASGNASGVLSWGNAENLLRVLFRIGMIGNQWRLEDEFGRPKNRNIWSFRGDTEPLIKERFVVHRSIRKVLLTV